MTEEVDQEKNQLACVQMAKLALSKVEFFFGKMAVFGERVCCTVRCRGFL